VSRQWRVLGELMSTVTKNPSLRRTQYSAAPLGMKWSVTTTARLSLQAILGLDPDERGVELAPEGRSLGDRLHAKTLGLAVDWGRQIAPSLIDSHPNRG
jgi:hypothetical protein